MDANGAMLLNDRPMQVVSLQEVIDTLDILSAESTHMVAVDRDSDIAPMQLSGTGISAPPYGITAGQFNTSYGRFLREDYNPKLRGNLGLRQYEKMRRNDGQVAMALKAVKTPVLAARWYMQPASQSKKDVKISNFIWDNLTKKMSISWPQFLTEALACADFGFYSFQKVFDIDPDGMVYWRKFATLHPLDLWRWVYDDQGGPNGGWFWGDENSSTGEFFPIEKLLVFITDREAGDLQGRSVLRPAYKHWYYKENLYKVDAIAKERHGIGIPVIKLPPGWTDDDKKTADNLGRNLRTNEKAHVTLPPMWDVVFAELKGNPVDCMTSIRHHDTQIARSVGMLGMSDDPGGALSDPQDLFIKSSRFLAEIVRDVINKWAIPELCGYNWPGVTDYPELRVRRVGDTTDWRQFSFAIRNFVGAGILTPDDKLEEWIRDEMDLPMADPSTARDVPTPQSPGTPQTVKPGSPEANAVIVSPKPTGTPTQSQAKNMNIGPGSNGRVGRDGQGAG